MVCLSNSCKTTWKCGSRLSGHVTTVARLISQPLRQFSSWLHRDPHLWQVGLLCEGAHPGAPFTQMKKIRFPCRKSSTNQFFFKWFICQFRVYNSKICWNDLAKVHAGVGGKKQSKFKWFINVLQTCSFFEIPSQYWNGLKWFSGSFS